MSDKTKDQIMIENKDLHQQIKQLKMDAQLSQKKILEYEKNYNSLNSIIESTLDILFLVTKKGIIKYLSPSVYPILGYERDKVIGTSFTKYVPKQELPKYLQTIKDVFQNKKITHFETKIKNIRGELIPIEITGQLAKHGKETLAQGTIRDISDRVQAAKEKKESEEFYRTLFEFSPSGIIIEDKDGTILDANSAWCKMLGYKRNEIVGEKIHKIADPENYEKVDVNIKNLLSGKKLRQIVKSVRKDGSERYVQLNERAIILPTGEQGILSISQDMTKEVEAQEALKKSEERLDTAIDSTGLGLWDMDYTTGKVYRNKNWAKMLGYKFSEISEDLSFWQDKIHPNDKAEVDRLIKIHRSGKTRLFDFEHRLRTKDGKWKWILNWGKIIKRDKDGKPLRALGTHIDIDKRKKAEEKLQRSEEKYKKLFEFSPDPIVIHAKGKVVSVNNAAVKFFEVKNKSQLINKPIMHFIHPDYRDTVVKRLRNAKTNLKPLDILEEKFITARGNIRDVEVSAVPFFDGENMTSMVVFRDITYRKRDLEKLRESEETYKGLFDNATEAIYIQDQEGRFVDVNQGAIDMYGYPKEFFVGKTPEPLSAPGKNDINQVVNYLKEAFKGKPQQFEFWGKRKNGEIFPKIVRLNKGTYFGKDIVFAFALDITDRIKTEQALQVSNKNLALLNAVAHITTLSRTPEEMSDTLAHELRKEFLVDAFLLDGFYIGTTQAYTFRNFDTINGKFHPVPPFKTNFNWKTTKLGKKIITGKKPVCILRTQKEINALKNSTKWVGPDTGPSASLIYVPMILGKNITGVISIQSYSINAYSPKDVELMEAVGRQIAPVVEGLMLDLQLLEQTQKLKSSEEKYRKLVDNSLTGIYITQQHILKFCNQRFSNIYGYQNCEELLETHINKLVAPECWNKVNDEVMLRESGEKQTAQYEFTGMRKDGSVFDAEVMGVRIEYNGKPAIQGTLIDITKRKLAEKELIESEEKFRILAEQSPNMIFINSFNRVVYANKKSEEIIGYTRDEIYDPEFDFMSFVAKDSIPVIKENFRKHSQGIDIEPYEYSLLTKKGKIVNALIATKLINYAGQSAILGIVTDITELKQAEKEISRLATLVEQSVESLIITDTKGTIQYVNPAFEKITGYDKKEIIGNNPRILKSGKHGKQFYEDMWSTISAGEKWEGIIINKRKNGNLYYEKAIIFPIKDKSNSIINYAGIMRDITMERKLENQLQQIQKMEAIGTLSGGVAHDFNNLLTVINGHTELALLKISEDQLVHKDLLSILNAGKRAEKLTSQLLAFSRKQIHQLKVVDINHMISNLDKMLRRLIPEDIIMQTNLISELPYIKADPGQIEQIIINLVINARDAINENKNPKSERTIKIETQFVDLDDLFVSKHPGSHTGPHILISIIDTGIGMDDDTLSRIFEPFFTTKEVSKGTGLGLATVYGIVKQNNGFIDVKSEPRHGSTFLIYWPATEEEPEPEYVQSVTQDAFAGKEKILFVEDDESVRNFACNAIKSYGYSIIEAINGKNALELLKEEKPQIDLLVTDLIMPEMNGVELAEHLKEIVPISRVLFLSGYPYEHLVEEGKIKEGINFLQKPYTVTNLLKKIRSVLDEK